MAKVCWFFSHIGLAGGLKMNHMSTLAVNHGAIWTKETNKQIQPMIGQLGMGPIKTIELKTYPNFGPLGSIWIKIMNLSDEDITKCLSGRGHCFKSQTGQKLTGETSSKYQYCYLDLFIWCNAIQRIKGNVNDEKSKRDNSKWDRNSIYMKV